MNESAGMQATEDLFTSIHKALRSMLYSLSSRLQTNDFADLEATRTLVIDLENDFAVARSAGCTLCILAHHAADEETVIFSSVAKVANALVTSLIADHHDLTRRELEIAKTAHSILALDSSSGRVVAGIGLNQAFNGLAAAYITHMNREEADLVPLMQQHYTDAQMGGMQGTIIGALPPDRLMAILSWMTPSLNVTELSRLLMAFSKVAPPPAVQAVTAQCASKVDPARWAEVKLRTGL